MKKVLTFAAIVTTALVMFSCPSVSQTQSVKFVWKKAMYAETYRLQVATDSAFASPVFDNSTLTDSTYTVAGLNVLTRYYWRVNASNITGTSPWSEIWWFTTAPPLPAAIVLLLPIKGAVGVK